MNYLKRFIGEIMSCLRCLIDDRPIEIYSDTIVQVTGDAWESAVLNEINDPTGYASLVSGSLRLEIGEYELIKVAASGIYENTSEKLGVRLFNNTTSTVIAVNIQRRTPNQVGDIYKKLVEIGGGIRFSVENNSHDYDLQFITTSNSLTDDNQFFPELDFPENQRLYIRRLR